MLNGKQVHVYVHRLVATTFINNIKNKPQINHKDGNKLNNTVSNLEYVTAMENVQHSIKNKLSKWANAKGELNNMSKLSAKNVKEILGNAISAKELAIKFRVSESCIYKIRARKRWQHIPL